MPSDVRKHPDGVQGSDQGWGRHRSHRWHRITALDSGIQCETGAYKNIRCGQDAQRARLAKPAPHPKKMDDEERYCRQVEQFQKIEAEAQARHATTEDELFPIYAECGMAPDDFVPATAERFAEYLMRANRMEA